MIGTPINSPGVDGREIDFSAIISAALSNTDGVGGIAGLFRWGPVKEVLSISDKKQLLQEFGEPYLYDSEDFFCAQSFLDYSPNLKAIRIDQDGYTNAVAGKTNSSPNTIKISNQKEFDVSFRLFSAGLGMMFAPGDGCFVAKYPGKIGNGLRIAYCLADIDMFNEWAYKSYFPATPATSAYCVKHDVYNDEIHLIVIDESGEFTGKKNSVLERYEYLSLCSDAIDGKGNNNYFVNVLNRSSEYVYWISNDPILDIHHSGMSLDEIKSSTPTGPFSYVTYVTTGLHVKTYDVHFYYNRNNLSGVIHSPLYTHYRYAAQEFPFREGSDGVPSPNSGVQKKIEALKLFENTTSVPNCNLLIAGKIPDDYSEAIILNEYLMRLAEIRNDAVALLSPPTFGSFGTTSNGYTPKRLIEFVDDLRSSSYGIIDSCAVKIYDEYHASERWIPANGIIAGLCARTDFPWISPAGFVRGQIKNIIDISFAPDKFERDDLYLARINPIIFAAKEGTLLYGDKTLYFDGSALSRINVRRLINFVKKAISSFSNHLIFEYNDEITRARFTNTVVPFLRDVKGKRGIYEFKVVCDETNNTEEIIDSNEFIADIFIQPARSINFIRLNFIATKTGFSFDEISLFDDDDER